MSAIVDHKDLVGAALHEPKGADTAGSGEVYVADGAGSGSFQAPPPPGAGTVDHGGLIGLGDDDHPQYFNDARLAAYLDRFHFENATPANNNTTTLTDFINQSVPFQNTALYKVSVHFVWSMNSGGTDFIADLLVNGTSIVEQMVWEPQDTAGGGAFGTDQRYHAVMSGVFSAAGAAQNVQFQFAASTTNDNAAVYRAHLFVERWT